MTSDDPRSAGEGESTGEDTALVDALDDEAARARLDDGARATVEDWRAMRALLREAREEGFDEEPPAAGSRGSMETLMAMARAHAPKPKQSWWARLTAAMSHPMLAAAAAVVVVGGAAGVLYMKGKQRVARPPGAERAPLPAREPAPPSREGDLRDVLEEHAPADRPGPTARTGEGEGTSAGSAAMPMEGAAIGTGTGAGGGGAGGGGGGGAVGGNDAPGGPKKPSKGNGTNAGVKIAPKPSAPATLSADAEDGAAGELMQDEAVRFDTTTRVPDVANAVTAGATEEQQAPAPPPPPPPPAVAPATSTPQRSSPPPMTKAPAQIAKDDDASSSAAARAVAVTLTTRARTAAKAGDCAAVKALSTKVRALDAAYHRDTFVRDADIARCL